MRTVSRGRCNFCSRDLPVSRMVKHLQTCDSRKVERKVQDGTVIFLKVYGRYLPAYWLFLEADGSITLEKLDAFLRNIWLECCGHLSCFTIDDIRYEKERFPEMDWIAEEGKDMKIRLDKILKPGMTFLHEYDYGSTTELLLKVISSRTGKVKDSIQVLAKNNPPVFKCVKCGNEATDICAQCEWGEAIFCSMCLKKHKCGEEMALPIVNSPRTGVCGYTG